MHLSNTTRDIRRVAYHVNAIPGTIVCENVDDFTRGEEYSVLQASGLIW